MKFPVYNGPDGIGLAGKPASVVWMDDGDAPAMHNEAVTFHEALRAP